MLICDAGLKQPDEQHRQLIGMGVMFRYDLSEDALKLSQIARSEDDISW